MNPRDAVIVGASRTPIGRHGGALATLHPHELLAAAQRGAVAQAGADAAAIDMIVTGCVSQVGEQSYNVGRLTALAAGYPITVPGMTIDAQCGSSQQAVNIAASLVQSGAADIVLASGVESMSRIPLGTARQGPGDPLSDAYRSRFEDIVPGESADRIADKWGISRGECDAWALRSQNSAACGAGSRPLRRRDDAVGGGRDRGLR